MKKMRFESIEMMMKIGLSLQDGINLAFKTLDDLYERFPQLEKPSIVIINDKEYHKPK